MRYFQLSGLLFTLFFSLLLSSCSAGNDILTGSTRLQKHPLSADTPFTQYVAETRKQIQEAIEKYQSFHPRSPYLGSYTSSEAAEKRGPFQIPSQNEQICWDPSQGGGKGFLLIHGLTDSPYLLKNVADSLHKTYPCALIRAVLLPGHGTIPGDSLEMRHEDWLSMTNYGVETFNREERIEELYIVGFSTGTPLAIRHMREGNNTQKVKGLVFLSTAVKAKTPFASFSPLVRAVKTYLSKYYERDGVRYESFSSNAGAEFYILTKDLLQEKYALKVPVLMAVSADDATIDAAAAREFFCDYSPSNNSGLIWYTSALTEEKKLKNCDNIATIHFKDNNLEFSGVPYKFLNLAHTAVPMSPADPHYGLNGKYVNCKKYDKNKNYKPDSDFSECLQGRKPIAYMERGYDSKKYRKKFEYELWRRGTFNPDYSRLEKAIICFSDQNCSLDTVLLFGTITNFSSKDIP